MCQFLPMSQRDKLKICEKNDSPNEINFSNQIESDMLDLKYSKNSTFWQSLSMKYMWP